MMKMIPKIVAVLLFLFAAAGVQAQTAWTGTYTFDENGGKTVGGTAIFVSHQIDVSEGDEGLIATLTSNGYQTSVELLCTAKPSPTGTKLMIYFEAYGENNMFEPYEQGDLLLTLERGKKGEILTTWGKLTPVVISNAKNGKVYFVKSN